MLTGVFHNRAWRRAVMAMKAAPYRYIRPAAKPSIRAMIRAGTIKAKNGLDWILFGTVDAVRGATLFPVKGVA